MELEKILRVIRILRNFNVESSPVTELKFSVQLLREVNIKTTDLELAIEALEDENEDLAEDLITEFTQNLQKTYNIKLTLEA